jgi:hypothetical protein
MFTVKQVPEQALCAWAEQKSPKVGEGAFVRVRIRKSYGALLPALELSFRCCACCRRSRGLLRTDTFVHREMHAVTDAYSAKQYSRCWLTMDAWSMYSNAVKSKRCARRAKPQRGEVCSHSSDKLCRAGPERIGNVSLGPVILLFSKLNQTLFYCARRPIVSLPGHQQRETSICHFCLFTSLDMCMRKQVHIAPGASISEWQRRAIPFRRCDDGNGTLQDSKVMSHMKVNARSRDLRRKERLLSI